MNYPNSLITIKKVLSHFGASMEKTHVSTDLIKADISWKDEAADSGFECEVVEMDLVYDEMTYGKVNDLLNELDMNKAINGDQLVIPKIEMAAILVSKGWDFKVASITLDALEELRIYRVDNGERHDFLCFHY